VARGRKAPGLAAWPAMVLPLLELPEALLLQHFIGIWDVGFGLCGDVPSSTWRVSRVAPGRHSMSASSCAFTKIATRMQASSALYREYFEYSPLGPLESTPLSTPHTVLALSTGCPHPAQH